MATCWSKECKPAYVSKNACLKVLKAFAEYRDLTLGDLLEGIVLHAFDGKCPFQQESLARIAQLKKFYGLDLDSTASHRLQEKRQRRIRRQSNDAKSDRGSPTELSNHEERDATQRRRCEMKIGKTINRNLADGRSDSSC